VFNLWNIKKTNKKEIEKTIISFKQGQLEEIKQRNRQLRKARREGNSPEDQNMEGESVKSIPIPNEETRTPEVSICHF